MVEPAAGAALDKPGTPADPSDPGEPAASRGRLVVHDRVMVRLAEQAARDTAGVRSRAGGLDRLTGRRSPRAEVRMRGDRISARLEVAATWPVSLPELGSAVQRNVAAALTHGAGLVVDGVDVAIEAVLPADEPPGRVLR